MPTTYAIPNGRTVMDATLYTGNGTTNTIVNIDNGTTGFKPDLVWMKSRGNNYDNILYDSVRGTGAHDLSSNATQAEGTDYSAGYCNLTAFNSNGFTVGSTSSTNIINNSGGSFVAWQWQAGQGTTSSNTNGSITSTVSVNATAGFSVVQYTGTGSAATVGHGLGVAPAFYIVKPRSNAGGQNGNWLVYHSSLGATQYLLLNTTAAATTASGAWNNTAPTSSVFSIGTFGDVNTNGYQDIAYCWAPVAGFSQFGSYTGNGSTDGPFIYLGFRPKWLMVKRTDATQNWTIVDTSRDTYNVANQRLFANSSSAEDTGIPNYADILSNGFKLRDSNVSENASGGTYIYAAFAENPFKYANAR